MTELVVTDVRLTTCDPKSRRRGLLGYLTFMLNGALRFDGVALRRTAAGQLSLTFPARRDRQGNDHPYVRPVDQGVRSEIERQVFAILDPRPMRCSS